MTKTYIRASKAWWAHGNAIGAGFPRVEEFILAGPAEAGLPAIEFVIEFHDTSRNHGLPPGTRPPFARLGLVDESGWHALVRWRDFFAALAEFACTQAEHAARANGVSFNQWHCTPDALEEILRSCGFVDVTETTATRS